ncbi:hypothetical protein GCM10008919_10660 [Selenomonas dianae]|uniref:Uncharacterized protein n=1 Tax=Selenomonas dianae TaxID=135079 RepID=A0ABP3CLK3_9FIRM
MQDRIIYDQVHKIPPHSRENPPYSRTEIPMPKMIGITGFERTTSSTSKRAENLNEATAINRTHTLTTLSIPLKSTF